jgi:hypothetical protein
MPGTMMIADDRFCMTAATSLLVKGYGITCAHMAGNGTNYA